MGQCMDLALKRVILLCHMVFRGLSVQRFDLFTGGFGFRFPLCQVLMRLWSDCLIYMWALEGSISGANLRGLAPDDVGVGWITHSWLLALVNVERLECNFYFALVLWFEVCIFPLLNQAAWCGCIMLQLL